jgi:alanyl-tRNA synthetase
MKSSEIRNTFIEFFKTKEHLIVPSAPIVVKDDPTLMFTNAGMNQFKDVFLGNEQSIAPRIADTQKCLRVSGKHNDLEEVGYDTYHHTMFEMLGNWSFGDYFKKEAISWAWELLTQVYGIDPKRLYVTVFGGDDSDGLQADYDACNFWKALVPEDRILYGSKKDNFWEMGDTGPCGPCSEIHADIRDTADRELVDGKELVNKDHPEVIEIWNLVFIEFNRQSNGKLTKLPAQHVDTGMGFERLCMVLQQKKSNYDTDIFQPLIQQIARLTSKVYGENKEADIAMRVIADHLRAVGFAIADGQLPSNTGAGYVIRRILRRAVRYGFTYLGVEDPFVYQLLPQLSEQMANSFPELKSQLLFVQKVIQEEEASFLRTLSQGIKRFEQYTVQNPNKSIIDGQFAFELFDTYGFPVDLTNLLAREKGLKVDMDGFQAGLDSQKSRSRKAAEVAAGDWVEVQTDSGKTLFVGYDTLREKARIIRYRFVTSKSKNTYEIVLDRSPFYAEAGGQVGDTGVLKNTNESINILNTIKENNLVIHISDQLPENPEDEFEAIVDEQKRLLTACNHSATHLMHAALRKVLGNHVEQKGSLVDHERLRFDFSHFGKMSQQEIRDVENIVNARIRENIPINVYQDMPIDKAKEMGAMALFGEKYGEKVRVVAFNPSYSVELCGGTHVNATGQIGSFRIISESAIAAGIRRIEGVTGLVADSFVNQHIDQLNLIKDIVRTTGDIVKGVQQMVDKNSQLSKQVEQLQSFQAENIANGLIQSVQEVNGVNLIAKHINNGADMVKNISLILRGKYEKLVVLLATSESGKVSLNLTLSDDLVNTGKFDAATIIRVIAKEVNGGGGGQKQVASAGGKNPEGIPAAIEKLYAYLRDMPAL